MSGLAAGFAMLLTPKLIAFMLVGVIVGIIFGAIPGLSATMAIVLFLPVTFNMTVYEAFAMLVALYIGGVSGGLVSAILINIPGSAMSIATTYDGNPMANSGHAQRALGIGIVFSFFGTVLSVLIMIFAAPSLASVAVKLGSYEFFSLTIFAVVLIASVSGKDIFKSLASLFLGLAFCMIGIAPVDGAFRYTFGITGLLQGVPLTPAVIGMFATSEILLNVGKPIDLGNFRLEAVHCPGHTPGTTSFFFPATYRGKTVNCAIHGGLGAGVLTDKSLAESGLPASLRLDYCESIDKVLDRPVDVVLPSHAGHPVDYDFLGIADGVPGAGDSFFDPTAWRRMLTAKRAEIVALIEQSKL